MDEDDELYSSILSLCENDVTVDEGKDKDIAEERKDESITLSPIPQVQVTPLRMADVLLRKSTSLTEEITPKAMPGFSCFRSMFLRQGKTSTPLMDKWSLTKPSRPGVGKRRHDTATSGLETICESSDDENTLCEEEDMDQTYDDLLQDLTMLCGEEMTDRWDSNKPPENKIKAEHQISRICLDSILLETSTAVGMDKNGLETVAGETTPSKLEPGRFTGVNTTSRSSVLVLEDSDSLEETDDILGLDDFLGSDDDDDDYDSLLEDSILQDDSTVTVIEISNTSSTSTHTSVSIPPIIYTSLAFPISHKSMSVPKSSQKSMIVPPSTHDQKSISVLNSSKIVPPATQTGMSVSNLSKTVPPSTQTSSSVPNLCKTVPPATQSTTVPNSSEASINIQKRLTIPRSSQTGIGDHDHTICNVHSAISVKKLKDSEDESQTDATEIRNAVRKVNDTISEDEFSVDLTKESDELDDFLQREGFKIIDDLNYSFDERQDGNKGISDEQGLTSKGSTGRDTDTESESKCVVLDQYMRSSPSVQKESDDSDSHVEKVSSELKIDVTTSQTGKGNYVTKVEAWQANISENQDLASPNRDEKAAAPISHSHKTSSQDKRLVEVRPFQMQLEPLKSDVEGTTETTKSTSIVSPLKPRQYDTNKNIVSDVRSVIVSVTPPLSRSNSGTSTTKVTSKTSDKTEKDINDSKENVDKVDDNRVPVSPALYYDYEAERRFIQGENELMKMVMKKWGSRGIQTPDTNLTFSNRLRQVNVNGHSRLEGKMISTLCMGNNSNIKGQHHKDKRLKRNDNSQMNNINDLMHQLQDVNRTVRGEIDRMLEEYRGKQHDGEKLFGHRKRALHVQQHLEIRHVHSQAHLSPFMVQCQLMQLRCEHEHQKEQLHYIYNTEMNKLRDFHQEQVQMVRSRFEDKTHQLKSFIHQLENVDAAQTDPQNGPHIVTHLVKGPCRSNNNTKSVVSVCLPADIATSILREDEVYDVYYNHPRVKSFKT